MADNEVSDAAKTVRLLVLAASVKYQDICIAGVDLGTRKWIRPVRAGSNSAIPETWTYMSGAGYFATPLDVVELELQAPTPIGYQPENWTIEETPRWKYMESASAFEASEYCSLPDHVLGSPGSKISETVAMAGVDRSLELLRIESPNFYQKDWSNGPTQERVAFTYRGCDYDLSNTDPRARLGSGRQQEVASEWLFTISLAEPWKGDCYKVLAAAIPLPPDPAPVEPLPF